MSLDVIFFVHNAGGKNQSAAKHDDAAIIVDSLQITIRALSSTGHDSCRIAANNIVLH